MAAMQFAEAVGSDTLDLFSLSGTTAKEKEKLGLLPPPCLVIATHPSQSQMQFSLPRRAWIETTRPWLPR